MTVTDLERYRQEKAAAIVASFRSAAAKAATEEEARELILRMRTFIRRLKASRWEPYPWQHPHIHPPGWVSQRSPAHGPTPGACDDRCYALPHAPIPPQGMFLELGGRGTGKTEGASHYVNAHAEGPPCDPRLPGGHKMLIVAPTQGDAVDACVTGPSGLQTINPGVTLTSQKGGTYVRWPNGTRGKILGAHGPEDVERLRAAGNNCLVWLEEVAAQRRLTEVLHHTRLGLRIGAHAHYVASTTPKNRDELLDLINQASTIITRGRTQDATRLDPAIRAAWEEIFAGTTLYRQEMDGEVLEDVEGALWVVHRPDLIDGLPNGDDRPGIDNDRVPDGTVGWSPHGVIEKRFGTAPNPTPPESPAVVCNRVAVGVDPAGGQTENGIVVVGEAHGHAYTLADLSLKAGPDTWGKVAVIAAYEYGAEGIALEKTFGQDQAVHVISTAAEALGLPMPALLRAATREGKKQRAIPVQALAQNHRIHMVGRHPLLENELVTWVEEETPESPNRLDAWVHAVRHLLVRAKAGAVSTPRGGRVVRSTSAGWSGTRRTR